jgi:hypothetical protein
VIQFSESLQGVCQCICQQGAAIDFWHAVCPLGSLVCSLAKAPETFALPDAAAAAAALFCACCVADGRGFHLLGAVLWAPLCGTLHWATTQLQIGSAVQAWLVKNDLLDLPHIQQQLLLHEQQETARAAAALQEQQEQLQQMPKIPVRFEDMDWQEKVRGVNAVMQRELKALQDKWREEEQEVLAEGLKQRQQQRQQQQEQQRQHDEGIQPQRKRWLLF